MFFKLGSFVYRARWAVVIVWGIVIVLGGIFAPKSTEILKSGGFNLPNAEAVQVSDELAARFNNSRSYLFAVFTAPDGTRADDSAYAKQVDTAVNGLRSYKDVQQVVTFASTGAKDFISANGKYTYALIGLNLDYDQAQARVGDIESQIKPGNLDMKLTGLPVIYDAFNRVSQHDVEQAELFTFPLALIILLLVFRTVIAAAMPLMMALVSVVTTLGTIFFVGQVMDVSIFVLNICTILGLGLGIDYSLFVVGRFREELYKQNGDVEGAVKTTIGTAGKAVFVSGLTVMIGLASLLLFQFTMLKSIGIGGLLVVGLSVLAALTLLPAVLGFLGHRINALKIPGLTPIEEKLERQHTGVGFWHRLAEWVSKRPVVVAVVVLAFLLFVGSPFLHIRFGEPTYQILPTSEPARQGADILDQNFPSYGKNTDLYVILKARSGKVTDAANSAAFYDYAASLKAKFPEVQKVLAGGQDLLAMPKEQVQQLLTTYGADPKAVPAQMQAFLAQIVNGDTANLKVLTGIEYSSQSATDFVKAFRAYQPAAFNVLVGGEQPGLVDAVDALYANFPLAILIVVIITYIVLFVMFQSVLLPIKAVIMTGLSLSASYGAMVWIFQDGNLLNILGGPNLGYVEATLPILLFAILFGLSMDYEVFMLSRIKEFYDETGNNRKSVAQGLERTGGVITSAALVMVVVAGAFATADIIVVKAIGLGMALAVAFDSTIVRALLVPATMELLGKANWWAPRWVRRVLPKFSVE